MWGVTNSSENCSLLGKNTTAISFLKYGGIPQNIAYNCIFYVILVVLFAIFRKVAGDYGRIALVNQGEERWTSMFYGDHSSQGKSKNVNADGGAADHPPHSRAPGLCDWIPAIFRIKDADIRSNSGTDAVQYLQFQRYLIILMIIITFLSLVVILPINFSGSQELGTNNFGRTTITNIPNKDSKLWAHTIFCMLYFLIVILFMRHFSMHLPYRSETDTVSRTLLVSGIPLERTDPALIKQHFQEAYPDVVVTDVQFAYDIARLKRLDTQRRDAHLNRLHCERIYQRTTQRPTLRPGTCGQLGCGGPKVDAIEYYGNEEEALTVTVAEEKRKALKSNLGMAFVSVHSETMATKIVTDYATLKTGPPTVSSVSRQLHSTVWEVDFAPKPDDIIWENLSISPYVWWLSVILINIALFVLLFFLTTPSVIMTTLDSTNYKDALAEAKSPFLSQFLPTLLLWTFAALLPLLVVYSSYYFEFHWTRTKLNHTIMRKTFIFLLLMILILPSLGLASAQALFEYSLKSVAEIKMRWGCIFLPENGAFFVNFIITSAFIGTALELIRFPELFYYGINMLWTRSEAEKITKRSRVAYEFQYGVQYAWILTTFTVVLVYSITCPLIAPFGLVYFVLKHLVDRYNIYFAYIPSRIHQGIHQSAINFVVIAGMLLQLSVLFFSVLRLGSVDPRSILLFVFLVLTIGLYIAKVCFNIWMGYVPPAYDEFSNEEEPVQEKEVEHKYLHPSYSFGNDDDLSHLDKDFVPDVLMEDAEAGEGSGTSQMGARGHQAYGTMDHGSEHISYQPQVDTESSEQEE
ncbi:calcium permeable stress-gated cation channel 1-like isoform X2 [Lytechinus variegatus]|uniref:calcium permeable stress-gated cation channel 1-like isoform X2 n=1 Tax=Lytechinus variegatus TaxID=7654 RepID=UPI001BB1D35E|nr:calcium permeable stress-gated cation channel 1-like isoform X2 [Lytechinus variegatus]